MLESHIEYILKQSTTLSAKADKAYQNALGLSTSEYIRLKELDIKKIQAEKVSSVTVIEGNAPVIVGR